MLYILLGCLGFIVFYLFDFVSLKGGRRLKWFVFLSGLALMGISFTKIYFAPDKFYIPSLISRLSWLLAVLFLLLFIYSNFIEIPFKKTYADKGVGDELVRTGTYALTRHPGVLWTTLAMIFLVLATKSRLLAFAFPALTAMNLGWVWLQDKFYLDRMFPGYGGYRKETPMLIPTRRSLRRCLRTMGRRNIWQIKRR